MNSCKMYDVIVIIVVELICLVRVCVWLASCLTLAQVRGVCLTLQLVKRPVERETPSGPARLVTFGGPTTETYVRKLS